ncbi:hypothetical protein AVEN_96165-1 [Araneus ventricosus]|uniref:Uncharacterized protein n=1 Tax=Araneus ventricosus TaxID=182803 RepID=A0A4Y2H633_ARAVE|nr:hypothetical protein AVEN_96165-1 [Araneus ventricosus]
MFRFDAVDTSPVFQQLKKGQNRIMDAITCVSKEIEIVNGQYRHVCFKEEGKYKDGQNAAHFPVPEAITATVPVGWTSEERRTDKHNFEKYLGFIYV